MPVRGRIVSTGAAVKDRINMRSSIQNSRNKVMIRSIAILLLSLAISSSADQWVTWRGHPQLSGKSETDIKPPLAQAWQYLSDEDFIGTPVGGDGQIFVNTAKGRILALSTKGEELWRVQPTYTTEKGAVTNDILSGPLALIGDIIVACSEDGRIYGVTTDKGEVAWTVNTGEGIQGAPVIDGNKVIVLTQEAGRLHCVDAEKGETVWVSEAEARADGHPSLIGDAVVYGNCNASLMFVSKAKGKTLQAVEFGEGHEIAGTAAGGSGKVYVGTRAGSLMCVDSVKRELVWEKELDSGELFEAPAVSGSRVVVPTGDGELVCFSGEDRIWTYESSGALGVPVIAGDSVFVVADGKLVALSINDGLVLDSVKCAESDYPPAIIDGMVIVAADDSSIYASREKETK